MCALWSVFSGMCLYKVCALCSECVVSGVCLRHVHLESGCGEWCVSLRCVHYGVCVGCGA